MPDIDDYFQLVRRLGSGGINRSENDLSANLKNALCAFGLHGVIDTGAGRSRAKRPDIALYAEREAADLGSAADVVIESKRPSELAAFATLTDALIDDWLWNDKFIPYVSAHSERISLFILTTFDKFLVIPIDESLRRSVVAPGTLEHVEIRRAAIRNAKLFSLNSGSGEHLFYSWCSIYLTPSAILPPRLSAIVDIRAVDDAESLEFLANDLADVVVGLEGRGPSSGALVYTIRPPADDLDGLDPSIQRALVVFTMAAHGGMSVEAAQAYIARHWKDEWSEFVSASIHSLIGRLFAIKAIEDSFCIGTNPPLIPEAYWIFHSTRFDDTTPSALPAEFFEAMFRLTEVSNSALKDLSATGRFYDWLIPIIDPAAFRRLLSVFYLHCFKDLDGDLLGRFFELYAQRVDRRRRKQLGQYYTPLPIVRHMWRISIQIAREKGVVEDLFVLDPGVGSGTFLIEGASQLFRCGIPRFWERLTGFDISPQAIGVAQVNVYLAILAHLDRNEAEGVGTLNLYPTDALDPRNGARLRSIMPLLGDESTRAFLKSRIDLSESVKQSSRFPLVIGNPPYRNNSDQTLAQVADRFPKLLRSSRANARARKRNIRDDYAWFFAAADHYVSDRGIISFVVSDSFCYAGSYRFFREDLLRRYSVRNLVILGASVFRDVGPRTQFVIIVLERRGEDLPRADDVEPFPVVDLRPLVDRNEEQGTSRDARLLSLDTGELPDSVNHRPLRERNFMLFPASDVVRSVEAFPNILHGESPRRVFIKKWPGVITAFDELFRADTREEAINKGERFFSASRLTGASREDALDDLAAEIGATTEKKRRRLSLMAAEVESSNLAFSPELVRRVVTGGAPNEVAWYPSDRLSSWIIYEPALRIPRNVHEGRDPGYGTMSQWRDPASHRISPKFVFTTSTNPDCGLKALLVPGDWMVKLHGGESQQFNYTGLVNPLAQPSLDGPNNLGADASTFYNKIVRSGRGGNDFLLYLMGIYNSKTSEDYLEGGGGNALRIPLAERLLDGGIAGRVINASQQMYDLYWLSAEAAAGIDADVVESRLGRERLERLGLVEIGGSGGRFRQRRIWRVNENSSSKIEFEIAQLRSELDEAVFDLYDAGRDAVSAI